MLKVRFTVWKNHRKRSIGHKQHGCTFCTATVLAVCTGRRSEGPNSDRWWSISSQHPCRKKRENVWLSGRKTSAPKPPQRPILWRLLKETLLRRFGWGSAWISDGVLVGKHRTLRVTGAPFLRVSPLPWRNDAIRAIAMVTCSVSPPPTPQCRLSPPPCCYADSACSIG